MIEDSGSNPYFSNKPTTLQITLQKEAHVVISDPSVCAKPRSLVIAMSKAQKLVPYPDWYGEFIGKLKKLSQRRPRVRL